MWSFKDWLMEDAGAVVGPAYNDVIMQSRVKSKGSAVENRPELSPDKAKCKFLGICPRKKPTDMPSKSLPEEL